MRHLTLKETYGPRTVMVSNALMLETVSGPGDAETYECL